MQIKFLFLTLLFLFLNACRKSNQLIDGLYYNKDFKDFLIIKESGKKQEIYDIIVATSFDNDSLIYDCMECPSGETLIKLTQEKSSIKVEAQYKEALINNKYFERLNITKYKWDSIEMCTNIACMTFYSDSTYKKIALEFEPPMTLEEELNLLSIPDFSMTRKVVDDEPVILTIHYKDKNKIVKETAGLFLYFRNLRYFVYECLVNKGEHRF